MRCATIIFCLILAGSTLQAQFGASIKYQTNSFDKWDDFLAEESGASDKIIGSSYEFGLNYWFRLKNQRIEFLPEIYYAKRITDHRALPTTLQESNWTSAGFNMNVHIYPLDFFNDCNCPTFSKDGNTISKGFYWILSPGISLNQKKTIYERPTGSVGGTDNRQWNAQFGFGAGLDIGVADIFTISPFVMYRLGFGHEWNDLYIALDRAEVSTLDTNTTLKQLNFGLRLMFRPDYVKQNRGFRR